MSFARAGTSIETAILTTPTRRVFILGKPPTHAAILGQVRNLRGAATYLDGHYPSVSWQSPDRGRIRCSYIEQWFGPGDYTTDDCVTIWRRLQDAIRHAWRDDTAALLMSPATTGRDLWQRTIPYDGWPVMSDEWQTRIRAWSGQGRTQTFAGGPLTSGPIVEYDARVAYCAQTRRLPIGEPVEVSGLTDRHAPGKYLCRWSAPPGWKHPGIIPAKLMGDGWHYPTTGSGWVDAVEVDLAIRFGWEIDCDGGYMWPTTGDPLRTWQTRLLKLRDQANGAGPHADMWRTACRAIILSAIGAMHGTPHRVSASGPNPPADAFAIRPAGPGIFAWHTLEPPAWPDLVHPEWTSTIWARARARLLDAPRADRGRCGALHIEPGHLIALRTDAIYTDGYADMGDDDGQLGRYRIKGIYPRQPWPRNGHDIRQMKAQAAS